MSMKKAAGRDFLVLAALGLVALFLAMSRPLNPLAFIAGSAIVGLIVWLGLAAAAPFGKGAPLLAETTDPAAARQPAVRVVAKALSSGLLLGAALLSVIVFIIIPFEPQAGARLQAAANQPFWKPWVVAFESAVIEELAGRLFLIGGAVWLLSRFFRPVGGKPRRSVTGIAIALSVIAFGAIHLPAWLGIVAHPTAILIVVVMVLNGLGGLLFSYAFWRWGIEAAILCHFAADIVTQVIGPRLVS
ncbi:MAG: hypothetical protein A2W03_17280 [Candidatus Aminicenantes bacterium RBG_16_63_16]|nr:MAG: hypothetical protein A2W03_17280 [Candidatus Aminicenantes bacterium RBG_16_63_16]